MGPALHQNVTEDRKLLLSNLVSQVLFVFLILFCSFFFFFFF